METMILKTYKTIAILLITSLISVVAFAQTGPFGQAPLNIPYDGLEPNIDAQTMEIHYAKHHAGYVKKLNKAVEGTPYADWTLEELMERTSETNEAIRNNGGGHYNHSLFWENLSKDHPFNPNSAVGKAIIEKYGSVGQLQQALQKAGTTQFGSGWAWLILTSNKQLEVCSTSNQDNPLMDIVKTKGIPLLAIDVWEHAYYLNYQNRRGDYLSTIMDVINWDTVNKRYEKAFKKIEQGWH
jgi:superoxide dismutase